MADFVAVLKKTIDAQADQSPELRQRVYAKARATIEQKLVTANASQAVAIRQRQILEDAIEQTEAFYAPPPPVVEEPQIDPLEEFLSENADVSSAADNDTLSDADYAAVDAEKSADETDSFSAVKDDRLFAENVSETPRHRGEVNRRVKSAKQRSSSNKGLILGLLAVLILGGAGYAVWSNKDQLQDLASNFGRKDVTENVTQTTGTDSAAVSDEDKVAQPQQPASEPKLTQRLLEDGSEVDEGSNGNSGTDIGEGKSTAAATGTTEQTNRSAESEQAVTVGQQALLYEERGGTESGSVERGNVVWSVIEESPSEGEPSQPAIRGDVTIPKSDLQLKITIRKNLDQSIPASHLIEMVFIVPDSFQGGVIENVQRITFKDTEQAAGNPLIAVPSKIGDNFFIVWLNDARTAQDTNLSLMRQLQWIDIPISYRNGRRALISLEKGVPGDKVFNEVLGTN